MTSVAEKPKSTGQGSSPSRSPGPPSSPNSSNGHNKGPSQRSSSASTATSGVASVAVSGRLTHQSSTGSLLGNMRSARDRDVMNLVPPAAECSYAACFCEENVWKLCDHVRTNSPELLAKAYVVFVSNKKQVVPLWRQRAGRDEEKLVIWDYHVIFISKPDERCLVFDLDSDLPFPTYFHKYVTETFRTDAILNPEYHRFFRVIPAQEFLQTFASDRRHMKKPDGAWMKPPPPYPCIMPTSESGISTSHNLDDFISMDGSIGNGEVLNLTEFVKKFFRN